MLVGIYIVFGFINILANLSDFNIPNTPELKDIRVRRSAGQNVPNEAENNVQNTKYDIKRIFNGEHFKERAKRSYPVQQQAGYARQVNTSWNSGGTSPGYYNSNVANTPGSNGYNTASGNNYSAGSYNSYPGYSNPGYYQYPNRTYPVYNAYPVYTRYPNTTYPGYNTNPGNTQYPGYNAYIPYWNNTYPGYNPYPVKNQYPGYKNANYSTNTYSPYNNTGYGYSTAGSTASGYNASAVTSTTPRIDKSCILCNIGCPQFMKRLGILCVKDNDDYD